MPRRGGTGVRYTHDKATRKYLFKPHSKKKKEYKCTEGPMLYG